MSLSKPFTSASLLTLTSSSSMSYLASRLSSFRFKDGKVVQNGFVKGHPGKKKHKGI
jgi:hypothetical protein